MIEAGVARVVAPIEDPDPRVSGRGFEKLRAAGIDVATGVMAKEAAELNAGFFLRLRERRPFVTLKIAASFDGRTTDSAGDSRWVTGEESRRFGHLLRARHDAILVFAGIGVCATTLLAASWPRFLVQDCTRPCNPRHTSVVVGPRMN